MKKYAVLLSAAALALALTACGKSDAPESAPAASTAAPAAAAPAAPAAGTAAAPAAKTAAAPAMSTKK
ncbi:MAG TPA: hypothetical protein VGO35_11775 [Gammaproteobacteria bacterium]|nr:hypothetical protein [Gammaproteobacteria bacterium]